MKPPIRALSAFRTRHAAHGHICFSSLASEIFVLSPLRKSLLCIAAMWNRETRRYELCEVWLSHSYGRWDSIDSNDQATLDELLSSSQARAAFHVALCPIRAMFRAEITEHVDGPSMVGAIQHAAVDKHVSDPRCKWIDRVCLPLPWRTDSQTSSRNTYRTQ